MAEGIEQRTAENIRTIPFDGDLIVVKDDSEIIALNEAARLIWETIARGRAPSDAARALVERYGLSPERARSDADATVAAFRARGITACGSVRLFLPPSIRAPGGPTAKALPAAGVEAVHIYALCGEPVCFRFQDRDVEALVHPLLSAFEVGAEPTNEVVDLYRDGTDHIIAVDGAEIGRCDSAEEALGVILEHVLEVSYPDAHWIATFHAGAVADDHGAIVLPGRSGSGKSTLTAALVHAGLRYLSDDVAPLDGRTMQVMPLPLATSLKRASWPVLARWFPDLEDLPAYGDGPRQRRYLDLSVHGGGRRCSGVPVRALVFPEHRSNATTRMAPIRPRQALGRLLQAGGWLSLDPQDLSTLPNWLLVTPGYELVYNSTEEAKKAVCDLYVN